MLADQDSAELVPTCRGEGFDQEIPKERAQYVVLHADLSLTFQGLEDLILNSGRKLLEVAADQPLWISEDRERGAASAAERNTFRKGSECPRIMSEQD